MRNATFAQGLRRSIYRDLARSSETGAPPLGHLVGLHRVPADNEVFGLALDVKRPAMAGGPGILEVAMLADLALGGAIRNRVGLTLPMPTISMSLQLAPDAASTVTSAQAQSLTYAKRTAPSRVQLLSAEGEVVGDAHGLFALPEMPYEGPGKDMPWDSFEEPEQPITDPAEAGTWESGGVIEQVAAHALGRPRLAWGTAHIQQQMATDGEELAMIPTEVMANRLGHVQGAALLTTAVLAAAASGGFAPNSLVAGTVAFLDAADLSGPLLARVDVLRTTGRSLFSAVRLEQGPRTCCHVSVVFRR